MKLGYIIFLSTLNLRKRKLRSFLTIGGMAIGIGAIVFLVSLGFGLQALITAQVTNVEALTILDVTTGTSALLKIDEQTIKDFRNIPKVIDVSPSYSISGQVALGGSVTDVALYGIDPKYVEIEGIQPTLGGVFTAPEAAETILSNTAAELLGLNDHQAIINQTVTFKIQVEETAATEAATRTGRPAAPTRPTYKLTEVPAKVVGVIDDELTLGYLPLTVIQSDRPVRYNLARVKVEDRDSLVDIRKQIEAMGFQVDSVADTVGQIDRIFLIFEIVMAGFGLIAMLVASLGAFNTLTISLLERTREVGIMKALGSTSKDVYRLFLTESFIIGFTGGGLGLLLGYASGQAVNLAINILARRFGGQPVDVFSTPILFVSIIFTVIVLVSFITGVYPARRASRLNPLNALRYE